MARQRAQPRFDPYAILAALEQERTTYILVGAFARVLVGADETTRGIDLTPPPGKRTYAASPSRSSTSTPAAPTATNPPSRRPTTAATR
jgi:hypothetical protein